MDLVCILLDPGGPESYLYCHQAQSAERNGIEKEINDRWWKFRHLDEAVILQANHLSTGTTRLKHL